MAFCRSCDVCLPTKLGGGRMRRLAKRVAEMQQSGKPSGKPLHALYNYYCECLYQTRADKLRYFSNIFNRLLVFLDNKSIKGVSLTYEAGCQIVVV